MNILGQGTTPYLQIAFEGYDISEAATIRVTIEQGKNELNLLDDRISVASENGDSVVTVHLTQEETLSFKKGFAEIQVRWKDQCGDSFITEVMTVNILKALYEGVI